jgi:ATP-dependent protease ClpP protease subunit
MTPEEAKAYGLIDRIIAKKQDAMPAKPEKEKEKK